MNGGIPGAFMLILACAVVTYLPRYLGYVIADRPLPPVIERFLRLVPVSAVAALTCPGLVSGAAPGARIIAAAACAGIILGVHRLWLGLLGGMAVYALLRYLGVG
ncbi:MAG: AzlD domain-containing protein [Chloroflexota bacterium]